MSFIHLVDLYRVAPIRGLIGVLQVIILWARVITFPLANSREEVTFYFSRAAALWTSLQGSLVTSSLLAETKRGLF